MQPAKGEADTLASVAFTNDTTLQERCSNSRKSSTPALLISQYGGGGSGGGGAGGTYGKKRCEFVGEYTSKDPNQKICGYRCKGYGAIATFPWPKNQPCPPSFDGNFPGP